MNELPPCTFHAAHFTGWAGAGSGKGFDPSAAGGRVSVTTRPGAGPAQTARTRRERADVPCTGQDTFTKPLFARARAI